MGAPGEVQLSWAQASGLNGPKHFQATFDPEAQGGTLRTYRSHLDGSARTAGAYYTNFLSQVKSAAGNYPYSLVSDVWNAYGGDGGWAGCKAQHSPSTTCRYVIRNIRMHTNDGKPMFSDSTCSVLNGNTNQEHESVV